MTGIFINYRRDDAPGVAGRLYDHLAKSFSRRDLFIDVDAIKPGLDFVKQLDTQVSQCDVLLALIGPHWLKAEDEQGGQRLQGDPGLRPHRDRRGAQARYSGDPCAHQWRRHAGRG